MGRWHNHYLDNCAHFITSSVVDWRPVLLEAPEVVYDEWRRTATLHGCLILAYALLPDHVHLIVWSSRGKAVRAFTQRWLSFTARRLGTGGRFWKERPRVLPVWSREVLEVKVDYIHRNPLRRGLVERPEDWPHSSYRQIVLGRRDVPFQCAGFADLALEDRP